MEYCIKKITKLAYPKKNYYHIGELVRSKCLYRYMRFDDAIKSLLSNTVRFCSPSSWEDSFEKHFYNTDYSSVIKDNTFRTTLSAFCVTTRPNCEAAWHMYTDDEINNPCIRFKIYTGQFREFLDKYAYNNNLSIYEGKIDYSINETKLKSIGNPKNKLTPLFFEPFTFEKYLNLMILKRNHFEYENEVRYLCSGVERGKEEIFIPIPWSQCLYSLQLPPGPSDKIKKELSRALEENFIKCLKDYPSRHLTLQKVPIVENTLYEPISPIIIN